MTGIAPEPGDRAIARLLAGGLPARIEIEYGQTDHGYGFGLFEDCDRIPDVGERVTVHHRFTGHTTTATVTYVDEKIRSVGFDTGLRHWP